MAKIKAAGEAVSNVVKKETLFKFTRDSVSKFKFGAHVGLSGGVSKSVTNAMDIGANSFALFLRSPRRWVSPEISDAEAEKFIQLCKTHGYNPKTDVLPHGLYFINLANPDPEKEEKSYEAFVDDLRRCEKLNIGLYNFHPGSSLDSDHKEALARLAKNINRGIAETSSVKVVIENMAGHGTIIGSDLQDIREVIDQIEDKSRVGVCVDTCHAFAAGYDINSKEAYEAFWAKFDEIIGREYLSAIHLNDSKAPLGANRDLHQNLGLGFLSLEAFRLIANDTRLKGLPVILETPVEGKTDEIYGEEIELLQWLVGKAEDNEEFIERKEQLAKSGATDRAAKLKQFKTKQTKMETASKKESASKKRKVQSTF